MENKEQQLRALVRDMGSVIVAFSGGVDSTYLLKIAYDELGDRAVGITAYTPSLPEEELAEAKQLAAQIGAKHLALPTGEMSDERYLANDPQRCYFCKTHLAGSLGEYAREHGYNYILDGNNADDRGDYRPGRRAAAEHGLRSPLIEVGMTKAEVREAARLHGLPNWDKPSAACLASRLPYGTRVTVRALTQVEKAERYLHDLGFRQVRVRHHGEVARIEVERELLARAVELADQIHDHLHGLGYAYVSLDLRGYRTGSFNELLGERGRAEAKNTA